MRKLQHHHSGFHVVVKRRQTELADIQAGIIVGFDQIERDEFAEGSGEDAIERAFRTAVYKHNL